MADAVPQPDVTATVDAARTWALHVDTALTGLPAQEECFLRLSYCHGLRSDRIATIAGVPVEYVRRVTAQGMQRLAALLEHPLIS